MINTSILNLNKNGLYALKILLSLTLTVKSIPGTQLLYIYGGVRIIVSKFKI